MDTATVVGCYETLSFSTLMAIEDYTEGMYEGDPMRPYGVAQRRQLDWLLDQVGCHRAGFRLLDVGCGNGTLLERARARKGVAIGITISPAQVRFCRKKGLDVHLLNWQDITEAWDGRFHGIVANGSVEHFVQPADAFEGRTDEIYRKFFATCKRLLEPGGRLATTVIHAQRFTNPEALLKHPFTFPWGSYEFHYSMLAHAFGGWYPLEGQLMRCAAPHFQLKEEWDGTEDYHLTSEWWLKEFRRNLRTRPRLLTALLFKLLRQPTPSWKMLFCLAISESWCWQFRPPRAPMKLLRQVWVRV